MPRSFCDRRKQFDAKRHAWRTLAAFVGSLTSSSHREMAWAFYDREHPAPKADPDELLAATAEKRTSTDASRRATSSVSAASSSTKKPGKYPDGGVWDLIRRTEEHPDYKRLYCRFPTSSDWHITPRNVPSAARVPGCTPPELMGMDCEMGETTEDENAVIGVGVVDDEGETVLDELISPPGALVDVRTEITGFKIEDFDGACTRERA